jgi:hypothetical protein
VRTCHRTIWFLQKEHIRPGISSYLRRIWLVDHEVEYHWLHLWKAIIGLLDFLGGKLDELTSTMGIEELLEEVMLSVFGPNLKAVAHCSYSLSSCWILHPQKWKPSSPHQSLSTNSL